MARFITSPPARPESVDVPTSLFLGLVTETGAIDLPEGASPDNQDMIFLPGGTDSRPGLHKLFAGDTTSWVYEKTYIQANDQPLNLFLDSAGIFWKEDVTGNPGVKTQIGQVAPGVYGQSVTAFGREFIAFSDALHGADIPRQYDGVNFDRVTQDGPATAPSVTDIVATVALTSVTLAASVAITTATAVNSNGLIQFTYTTAAPHGILQGQLFLVQGVAVPAYNGVFSAQSVPDATHITIEVPGTLPANSAGGTLGGSLVTVVVGTAHGMNVGDAFTFTGNAGTLSTSSPNNPRFWVVASVLSPTSFTFDLVNQFGVLNFGQPATTGGAGGTLTPGGMISPGVHKCVQMFLTRLGFLTKPSPPASWTCSGYKQAAVSNLAIGPSNILSRVLAFTGAGGGAYFTIGLTVPGGGLATLVADNSSTTTIVDFSDNTLFAAEGIDIPGNNLFAQRTLGPCLGFTFYGSRIAAWGEYRRIENLINMGFEGGTAAVGGPNPLGWTIGGAGGGTLVPGNFGDAWRITGDGSVNAKGGISQTAYQDYLNLPIVQPSTQYSFRLWVKASAAGLLGNIQAVLSSASTGFTATAAIAINTCSIIGTFVSAQFSQTTPAVIPADMTLTIQETGLNNLATVILDELMIIFTNQPYWDNTAFFSYAQNPEAFDGITGKFQLADDDSALRFFTQLRKTLVIASAAGLHRTIDNGLEPADWDIDTVSHTVGALSFRAGDPGKFGAGDTGEEWIAIGSYAGLYLYGGGPLWKVSQENQPIWDRINKAAEHTLWIKNDPTTRRIYLGLPLDQATAPNCIYPLDYRELDTDSQIAGAPSVRISQFSGKMLATDMARKWTRWNVTANCGELLARPNGVYEFCVGAGNGVTPGQQPSFGNAYFFDPARLVDDDYGQMVPYWTSYFFVNHDQEQQLQLGGYRKLFTYMALEISGVGQVVVTPLANALANPRQAALPRTLSLTPIDDVEIPLNVPARRCAFKIAVIPAPASQNVKMSLRKLIVSIRKHPISPISG